MTAKLMVAALAAAGALQLCAADPLEGLKFKMDFRTRQAGVPAAGAVGNALNVSGAVSNDGSVSGGNKNDRKPQQETATFTDVMRPWKDCTEQALYFPQYTTDADGTMRIDPVAMSFPDSAVTSDVQTAYLRFNWAGAATSGFSVHTWMIMNGYDYSKVGQKGHSGLGWALSIYVTSDGKGYLGYMVSPSSASIYEWGAAYRTEAYQIAPNTWYDLFVTFEPNEDGTKTLLGVHLTKAGVSNRPPSWTLTPSITMKTAMDFSPSKMSVRLGNEGSAFGWSPLPDVESDYHFYAKAFRGRISRMMLWSRKLTADEMWQVIDGCYGATWNLGIVNGSADEFAATTAADSVWEVTNGWSKICRELTAEHPTLTITDTVVTSEAGLNKILDIEPILSGASAYPVAVSVNGEKIGEYDLATDRAIQIPGAVWKNGADGKVTIEIERLAPFTGKLELDAVTLCGGWKMKGTAVQGEARAQIYIGERDPAALWRATECGGSSTHSTVPIDVYVPEKALGAYRYYFSIKFVNPKHEAQPHQLLVNGHEIASCETVRNGQVLQAEIPSEYLVAGHNDFRVKNNSTVYGWVNYDYYQVTVKQRHGMTIIVR